MSYSVGKFFVEGLSVAAIGHVIVSLPDGFAFPVSTSATEFPPSSPGCHAQRIASTLSLQLAVSITEPELMITMIGLPCALKASLTLNIMSLSHCVRLNSPSIFLSSPSPACLPIVIIAASARLASCATHLSLISISSSFGCP